MFKSLRFRILFIIFGVILMMTATFLLFARKEVEKAMTRSEQEAAKNALKLVMLNIENEYDTLIFNKKTITEKFERQLKYLDEIVITYIDELYDKAKNGTISEKTAKALAIEGVRKFRYGEDNYFFIMDKKAIILSHPDPKLMYSNLLKLVDINGKNIGQSFMDIAHSDGEGYTYYWWRKLNEEEPLQKMTYVKMYPKWEWVIGTGVYIDEIEKEMQVRKNKIFEGLKNTFSKIKIAKTGYLFVFDGNKKMLIHPYLADQDVSNLLDPVTKKNIVQELIEASKYPDQPFEYLWDKPDNPGDYKYLKQSYVAYFKPLDWYVASTVYVDEMQIAGKILSHKILYISITFFIIAVVLSLLFARTLTVPIINLVKVMKQVKNHGISNLKAPVSGTSETKELGTIFNNMMESIDGAIKTKEEYRKKAESNMLLAAIGKISSHVAHDMRSPISTINWYLQKETPDEDAKKALKDSTYKLNRMADELLDYAKASKVEPVLTSVKSLVESTVNNEVQKFANERGVKLTFDISDDIVAKIDHYRMGRVLINLITNAIQAIDDGVSGEVKITVKSEGDSLKITVADNGNGIEKESLDKIFDSFFTKGKVKGTGLGLSYCKNVIEAHGGTIAVESELGKGTIFLIEIPYALPLQGEGGQPLINDDDQAGRGWVSPSHAPLVSSSSTANILVVDDDIGMILQWNDLIQAQFKLQPITAKSPEEIMGMKLDFSTIKAAIVDYEFKGSPLTGLDIVRYLKEQGVKTIHMCTGKFDDEEFKAMANAAGITSIIPKPISLSSLESLV
ncbi:MAG: cache domain-containing protein [Pseudomonadota bacterium]